MGFPEDYTKISSASENFRNRRVKLLANAIAVNNSEWIAQSCSNAIRNKVAIDDEEEKNGCTPSFLSTRKIIEEKFTVLRRKNGETIRISSLYDKDKNFPECGLIDLKSNSDEILIPKGDIHRYPVLNTYVPLPIFLKYKNTRIGDKKKGFVCSSTRNVCFNTGPRLNIGYSSLWYETMHSAEGFSDDLVIKSF